MQYSLVHIASCREDYQHSCLRYFNILDLFCSSNNESPLRVFLYYTEDKGNGTSPIGNRLYRYDLVNNKLINPKLLLDLPVIRDSWGDGGAITIGPDNNIYVTMGSAGNDNYTPQTMTLNYRNSMVVDGRAGILRITQDGKPVAPGYHNLSIVIWWTEVGFNSFYLTHPRIPIQEIKKLNPETRDFFQWKKKRKYGHRWMAETAFSSIKRTYGEYISATKFKNMVKEMILKISLYNLFRRMT